jgi:RNA-directed DNA polymerase
MTAEIQAGAASHDLDWHEINWRVVFENVRRLQARIVKATRAGQTGKVKALQRLLTHSFSGKALAVRRVTENQGKNTPGVDGETWNTPQHKTQAVHSLRRRGYKPRPLKRVYIPKSNGKMRPLGIPTIKDRAMQALYLLALEPVAETKADPNSFGFRRERSTADAIQYCFMVLCERRHAEWVLEGDIKSCFDQISHEWLLKNVPMDKRILSQWLKAGFMERSMLYPTIAGTPQGGIISPVLANLALDGLQTLLRNLYVPHSRRAKGTKINLVRYADDFIITGGSKELLENEVQPLVRAFLAERGLELSAQKTRITRVDAGFDFLGQHVRKYDGVMLIKPSKKNVKAFLTKVRKIVKDGRSMTAGNVLARLNPVIRGWANYHRHVVSSRIFQSVDSVIFWLLWRWAKRRHPMKNSAWVRRKYFGQLGQDSWVFHGELHLRDGSAKPIWLVRAAKTSIQRHVKIKGAANPFDPAWEKYFEARLQIRIEHHLQGRRFLLRLWREQGGLCPVCDQPISEFTGWHSHHIRWRSLGGSDSFENRVLLHANCHRQVHDQGLTVGKLRPIRAF